jgi:hypothetical protein
LTSAELRTIYDRTGGYCHLCERKLAFTNYGKRGRRGAWHIEHSVPRANGGTNHGNNLKPSCIECNLEKGTLSTRAIRARNGRTRSPISREKRRRATEANTVGGAVIGGLIGAVGGPLGMAAGAWLGGAIGRSLKQ